MGKDNTINIPMAMAIKTNWMDNSNIRLENLSAAAPKNTPEAIPAQRIDDKSPTKKGEL